jgi:hypothetical protein
MDLINRRGVRNGQNKGLPRIDFGYNVTHNKQEPPNYSTRKIELKKH